jgi:hypothetical protein
MSDAPWDDIQALKNKRHSWRESLEKRKKERQSGLWNLIYTGNRDLSISILFFQLLLAMLVLSLKK